METQQRWEQSEKRKSQKRKNPQKENQAREKLRSLRNTVFFPYCFCGARGTKIVGSLKRPVRSRLARGEIKNCTPLWRKVGLEVIYIWLLVKTLVPSEHQFIAGIYGCSSHQKCIYRYWPIPICISYSNWCWLNPHYWIKSTFLWWRTSDRKPFLGTNFPHPKC